MRIEVAITTRAIKPRRELPPRIAGRAGAVAEFRGVVRDKEDGRSISAIEFEAYSPMAQKMMRRILEGLAAKHRCLCVRVTHRVGIVPAGQAAIHVLVAAEHRAPAFGMLADFMDRLKQDVPIWKRCAVTAGEEP